MLLFRRFRYAIPVGLVALLLALVFMGTSSTPADESAHVDLDSVPEEVVRELYDSSGNLINPDRQMQSASRDNVGGYGGHYYDENDPSKVYVYMTDMTQVAAAETAYRSAERDDAGITNVVVVQGRYSMDNLVDWFYEALNAFDSGGVDVNSAGLRPRDNQFSFTIGTNLDDAWAIIDGLGIPRDALTLKSGGEWIPLSDKDNVTAKWRPGVGGIKIQRPSES